MCFDAAVDSKAECNRMFHADLRVNCRYAYYNSASGRGSCYVAANTYYGAVTANTFYDSLGALWNPRWTR